MILKQYYLNCLAQASYLIADETTKRALIVDPRRDIAVYLADAERLGLRITHAILTHFHADFVAGHIELRDRVGARIALGARAEADFGFVALAQGGTLDLGPEVRVAVLETPGHTPEGISLVVYDKAQTADRPHAVLTGDTLFIGDVGRPDLMASVGVTAEELAAALYDSLHQKLLPLPDTTLLYPGHGAGSLCGRALGSETVSTLGDQRRYNYALQPMSQDAFVSLITADQPAAPGYFARDADLNRRERPTLDDTLPGSLTPLPLERVLELGHDGVQLLDVHEVGNFAAAHLRGSINVGLDGQFASWAGTVLDLDQPLVVIADPGDAEEAAIRLGRIGFDRIVGYLDGGMSALAGRNDLVDRFDRYAPRTLAERLADAVPPFLLDVRAEPERLEGAIEGSTPVPLPELQRRMDEFPRDGEIAVYCAGGYRSAIAASLLQHEGFSQVTDLAGSFAAWAATVKS